LPFTAGRQASAHIVLTRGSFMGFGMSPQDQVHINLLSGIFSSIQFEHSDPQKSLQQIAGGKSHQH
jgi:hypothetical protein